MDDKDKYRLWDEENKQMHYDDFVITSTGFAAKITEAGPNIFQFDQSDLEFDKKMKKMRCIGFGDKEGTLIYELDYIKYKKETYKLNIDKFLGITLTNILNGDIIVMDDLILFDCEVISNEFECNTKI